MIAKPITFRHSNENRSKQYYLLEVCLQIITAPHVLIRNAFVTDAILEVFLDGIVRQVDASTDI